MPSFCDRAVATGRAICWASFTLLLLPGLDLNAQPTNPLAQSDIGQAIKVLSYNIRYGTASDGGNHWKNRCVEVANLIRTCNPDLFGVQESLAFQTDFLREQFPAYEVIGVGRDDGKLQGEMVAVFFRRDRFQKIDSGNFWLSESPDAMGSKSWDSAITRMATWVRLKDLQDVKRREFVFLNTHFDHIGETARIESSKLLRKRLRDIANQAPLIITGDFNAAEGSQPYQALLDNSESELRLMDTFRKANPAKKAGEGTFSNFLSNQVNGPRIDWIVASSNWKVDSASIDRTAIDGKTPSDHFPVIARLVWPGEIAD